MALVWRRCFRPSWVAAMPLERAGSQARGSDVLFFGLSMRRRTLITPPIKWRMTALPVAPPPIPVIAERGGTQLRTPKPLLVVDTREKNPFSFERFHNWFSGIERRPLELGDYSVAGLESRCVVERKDLNDLTHSFHVERSAFV